MEPYTFTFKMKSLSEIEEFISESISFERKTRELIGTSITISQHDIEKFLSNNSNDEKLKLFN